MEKTAGQLLADLRWGKKTEEQRKKIMAKVRAGKRAKNKGKSVRTLTRGQSTVTV